MKRTALLTLALIALVSACAKTPHPEPRTPSPPYSPTEQSPYLTPPDQTPEAPQPKTPAALPIPPGAWEGRVVRIIDGDTIEVMHGGRAERIRLNGIDCPEKAQAFGTRAKQFSSQAAFGKTVRVLAVDTDRYGRTVADVYLPDGSSLNHALVGAGLAWWYRQYAPGDQTLATLEAQARGAKIGLWRDPTPVAPWDFRHRPEAAGGATPRSPPPIAPSSLNPAPAPAGRYVASRLREPFHYPTCTWAKRISPENLQTFNSREEAIAASHVPCKVCRP